MPGDAEVADLSAAYNKQAYMMTVQQHSVDVVWCAHWRLTGNTGVPLADGAAALQ